RQALAQTGGNVVQAARLLGISRDTMRYRMLRSGIQRSRPAVEAHPGRQASTLPAGPPATAEPAPLDIQPQEGSLPPDQPRPAVEHPQAQSAPEPDAGMPFLAGEQQRLPAPEAVWAQKPVAVLALEVTWPEAPALAPPHYEPWTEAARWDQAIRDKVQGFGG